ncbi:MAG: SUF system Fe-S cluster assembly regulator [Gammaproteobacteria bacterium]|jgi:FeS assembly SUF system regulator
MLRIGRLTDYGTMVLAELAARRPELRSAGQVAETTRIGHPTVSKLLKSLARAGLVTSERGSHGGYTLSRPADQISAADIIDALEGPLSITECSSLEGHCDFEAWCHVGTAWQQINERIRTALGEVSLAELCTSKPAATEAGELRPARQGFHGHRN